MPAPIFSELTAATAYAYGEWLAATFNTAAHGAPIETIEYGERAYIVPFADGTSGTVWLEAGQVYGEA